MCVSVDSANFNNTVLVVNEARHPQTNRLVHVLTYRNRAINFADSPNAMVLHFPAKSMSQNNVVDTSRFPGYVDDIVDTVRPKFRGGRGLGAIALSVGVEVFDHGIYTVILARNATLIPDALPRVPREKRPRLNRDLFAWYGETWPNWPIALCCFNNAEAVDADPMMWWYDPLNSGGFLAPAVDCHTGGIPNMEALVDTDHWVIAGSWEQRPGMERVTYTREERIPPFARALLPDYVAGQRFRTAMRNGDFIIPVNAPNNIERAFVTGFTG